MGTNFWERVEKMLNAQLPGRNARGLSDRSYFEKDRTSLLTLL